MTVAWILKYDTENVSKKIFFSKLDFIKIKKLCALHQRTFFRK